MKKSKKSNYNRNRKPKSARPENSGLVCFFDGACNLNPYGHMGIGCHINDGPDEIFSHSEYFPPSKENSNNVAEYVALNKIFDFIFENGLQSEDINIYGDSEMVIKQMNGKLKISSGLYVGIARECLEKKQYLTKTKFHWVNRSFNLRADELSKKAFLDNDVVILDQEKLIKSKCKDATKIVFPFGKYHSQPIASAPPDYLDWVMENFNFSGGLEYIRKTIVDFNNKKVVSQKLL